MSDSTPTGLPRRARLALPSVLILLLLWPVACLAGAPSAAGEPAPPAADPELRALFERLSELSGRVGERVEQIMEESEDTYALALLKVEKALINLEHPFGRDLARHNLREAVTLFEALADGEPPELKQRGLLERAYLADNDGSAQPYLLYVPETYDGSRPFGLLVFLHGYTFLLNKANWTELMYSEALETLADESDCIALLPFGRGNTDFQGVGEDDVMRAIREVKDRWRIDPDRVFLSGMSMGGMGVWTIGGHYPHEFAALIAMASRGDYYMWKAIERGSLPPYRAKMADGEFGAEMIPNYRNLRCVLVHGLSDQVMPLEQSERMHALLSAAGFGVDFARVEGADHYSWTELFLQPEVLDCLKEARRERAPRTVTFRTWTLKHSRAYWAEVLAIEDWDEPADLRCELSEDGASIEVRTANVGALRLAPPQELRAPGTEVAVVWNGREAGPIPAGEPSVQLGEPGGSLSKTPQLHGPIREAFAGPFLMVWGGDVEDESFTALRRAGTDWALFSQGRPPAAPARQVTQQMMERLNLIVFGTAEDNELMARIEPALPIKRQDGRYVIGEHSFDASRYGLCMIYPNPLAPERYVVVNWGPLWGKGLPANHKYDMLPDFIVFTEQYAEDGTDSNRAVCAGFFDQRWQLSEESTWLSEDVEGR